MVSFGSVGLWNVSLLQHGDELYALPTCWTSSQTLFPPLLFQYHQLVPKDCKTKDSRPLPLPSLGRRFPWQTAMGISYTINFTWNISVQTALWFTSPVSEILSLSQPKHNWGGRHWVLLKLPLLITILCISSLLWFPSDWIIPFSPILNGDNSSLLKGISLTLGDIYSFSLESSLREDLWVQKFVV